MPTLTAVGKGEAAELLLVKARGWGQVSGSVLTQIFQAASTQTTKETLPGSLAAS